MKYCGNPWILLKLPLYALQIKIVIVHFFADTTAVSQHNASTKYVVFIM